MKRRGNLKQMNKGVRMALMSLVAFLSVILLAEMVMGVYQFNHSQQKTVNMPGVSSEKQKLSY